MTGTWRDATGANKPENALIGQQFVGQNTTGFFPMRVSAAQGQDRLWRYTGLDELATGATEPLGSDIARLGVGRAGRQRLRARRRQDARRLGGQRQRPAGRWAASTRPATRRRTCRSTRRRAARSSSRPARTTSGARSARTSFNEGGAVPELQQFTVNALADMGVRPATPASGIVLDTPIDAVPRPANVNAVAAGTDTIVVSLGPGAGRHELHRSTARVPRVRRLPARRARELVGDDRHELHGHRAGRRARSTTTSSPRRSAACSRRRRGEASATTPATGASRSGSTSGGGAYATSGRRHVRRRRQLQRRQHVPDDQPDLRHDRSRPLPERALGRLHLRHPGRERHLRPAPALRRAVLRLRRARRRGQARIRLRRRRHDRRTPTSRTSTSSPRSAPTPRWSRRSPGVRITDGTLNLRTVRGVADDPEITAIEVIPAAAGGPADGDPAHARRRRDRDREHRPADRHVLA